jgi:hypothetical protein
MVRIPAWVGLVAFACALLLSGGASALPARWQELALYTGVGLAFAAVGGIVFSVLMSARPDWQGPTAVAGAILGVIPLFILWHKPQTGNAATELHPSVTRSVSASSPPRGPVVSPPQPREVQLGPELAQLSDLIQQKAQNALDRQDIALSTLARGRAHARGLSATLASVERDLEEVQSELLQIKANKARSRGELAAVIGDTKPVEGLIATLSNVRSSLLDTSDQDSLSQQAGQLVSAAAPVRQWIKDCGQRIKGLSDAS